MKIILRNISIITLFIGIAFSCSNDDQSMDPDLVDPENPSTGVLDSTIVNGDAGKAIFFDENKISPGFLLVNNAASNRVYLMDHNANIAHEWDLDFGIGNDATLMEDGNLLVAMMAEEPGIEFGGYGGKIQILNQNSEVLWNYDYSTNDFILHHDIELLPNGNILALAWERIPESEAQASGSNLQGTDLFPEVVIEIDRSTNEIVWQWRAWDHIVQDFDSSKDKFGNIAESPHLIDLNYFNQPDGDIMHANGLAYDPIKDVIFISANHYNEVWVIDHSTNTNEVKTGEGGNYNKGGDLIYRFGNAETYKQSSDLKFDRNHFPNFTDSSFSSLLIYSNNITSQKSKVYELNIPNDFTLNSGLYNEPEVKWTFEDEQLYAPKVSGAVRLPNGNTLITEGDFGAWEVTNSGEVIWKFTETGFFWRIYHYAPDSAEIQQINL